jgi:hypothetical protein
LAFFLSLPLAAQRARAAHEAAQRPPSPFRFLFAGCQVGPGR